MKIADCFGVGVMRRWNMKMNDKSHLDVVISFFEDQGARFVDVNEARELIKFDIPRGTRYDDKSILSDAHFACKTMLNLKLAVRWVDKLKSRPIPAKLAYENEINVALREIFIDGFGSIEDEGEFIYKRDDALKTCGTSITNLSDGLMKGMIAGHSIEDQLKVITEVFKRIYRGFGL